MWRQIPFFRMKHVLILWIGLLIVVLSTYFYTLLVITFFSNDHRSYYMRYQTVIDNIGFAKRDLHIPLKKTAKFDRLKSHALENVCKYPILTPDEETIKDYVSHPRVVNCSRVQEDYVIFDLDNSTLKVDQKMAVEILGVKITCFYRPIGGTERPNTTNVKPLRDWLEITEENTVILHDQFEVKCHPENAENVTVFRFAFAQIATRPGIKYSSNTDSRLSVDILVLDSTSLNMFRRHMPRSFKYMKNEMEFYHLEGYNKVADNSMVNLLPVLAGLRYVNGSYQNHSLESELPEDTVLDLDSLPFIWKDFSAKGCPTMFNDDVMHHSRGIFHYPPEMAQGFFTKPTDYFFRPWHVWQRRDALNGTSQFCFGNQPYHRLQLQLIEQMIKVYSKNCHFSFSFITDLPHDHPSNLERMDDDLRLMLENLHNSGRLNHTALIIMGDHGHRINLIMYTYIGRIEERMSFFSVYFPPWFRRLHPDIIANLELNKNRLTSNYDVNRLLKDIVDERFDVKPRPSAKGISLFSPVPVDRTCYQANIPDNHCPCMELVRELNETDRLYKISEDVLFNYTEAILSSSSSPDCFENFQKIIVRDMFIYTTNQMIQHGVRSPTDEFLKRLETHLDGEIEYIEITYFLEPWTEIEAKIRLQHNKKFKRVFVNSQVYLANFDQLCMNLYEPKKLKLCSCLSKFNEAAFSPLFSNKTFFL